MNDMSEFIIPKSDQINFDHLQFSGPITIRITEVNLVKGDQPCIVHFGGDKVFKPCKNMRKLMVHVWGKYTDKYVGHSLTLFGDPDVLWGGKKTGGVRISHMTGIDKPLSVVLTETKGKNKPYTVQPLNIKQVDVIDVKKLLESATVCAKLGLDEYGKFWQSLNNAERSALKSDHEGLKKIAGDADKSASSDGPEME